MDSDGAHFSNPRGGDGQPQNRMARWDFKDRNKEEHDSNVGYSTMQNRGQKLENSGLYSGENSWADDFTSPGRAMNWEVANRNDFPTSNLETNWGRGNRSGFSIDQNRYRSRNGDQWRQGRGFRRKYTNLSNVASDMYAMEGDWNYPQERPTHRRGGFQGNLDNPEWDQPPFDLRPYQDFSANRGQFQGDYFRRKRKLSGDNDIWWQWNMDQAATSDDDGRTIYIRSWSKSWTERQLFNYFSRYGKVENIDVQRDAGTQRSLQYGSVTYVWANMARRVLAKPKHVIWGREIEVSARSFYSKRRRYQRAPAKDERSTYAVSLRKQNKLSGKYLKKIRNRMAYQERRKMLMKHKEANKSECVVPDDDPHLMCIFCRSTLMSILNACMVSTCFECCTMEKPKLKELRKVWMKSFEDKSLSCFWNMTPFGRILEPFNVTPTSAHCSLCLETFEIGLEMKHVKEENHRKSWVNRNRVYPMVFNNLYRVCLKLSDREEMSGALMKFCKVCFLRYGFIKHHQTKKVHKMIEIYRRSDCKYCEFDSSHGYEQHEYTHGHLLNVWHHKIMSGEKEMFYKDPDYFGMDYVREKKTAWCEACEVLIERNGVAIMDHCKTEEHYKQAKIKKEAGIARRSKKKQKVSKKEVNDETNEDPNVDDPEDNQGNGGIEDHAEGGEEGIQDDEQNDGQVREEAECNEGFDDAAATKECVEQDADGI